jgi:alpha-L-fucosidase
MGWFQGAGLGMFIHWDHASQQGLEISWPLVGGSFALPEALPVSVEGYHSSAATFDPVEWDPKGLADLAARAGMTYAVFTAKHHSGYAMFHTRHTDFSIEHSPYGRDLVREYVDAMRAAGLRVGIYYSLSDWHHPDYPAFTEADKPYRFGQSPAVPPPEQWERYLVYLKGQLEELLTNYGQIDLLWFDGAWERPTDMWRPQELRSFIHDLQPDVVINDRLPGAGDYETPEQFIPPQAPEGPWETCMTMNESWGFNPRDKRYKSNRQLIHALCEVTGRGGNFLLNISPTGTGAIPAEQLERLEALAKWTGRYADSVIGVEAALEPWQFYGPTTKRGNRIYLHLLMRPYDSVTVRGVPVRRVKSVTEVASGRELKFATRTSIIEGLMPDPPGELRIFVPEEVLDGDATIIAVDID